ncbi:E3 ubiquitin-protein ligase MARCHF8 [Taenia crassiceps]|uniref:E3 ubiquitin-protein ligase MARCHF8 n=1 Tax=Taenia crassiceps TaxID=6207 RepID=A0ABR4Q071_9CEST
MKTKSLEKNEGNGRNHDMLVQHYAGDEQQEERMHSRDCDGTESVICIKEKQKPPTSIAVATASISLLLTSNRAVNNHCVGSTTSTCPNNFHFCRICREPDEFTSDMELDSREKLIAPCLCDGTLKYVHEKCIRHWIEVSQSRKCELCRFEYEMFTHTKPIKEWDRCLFFSGLLCNLIIFDTIIFLLIVQALWWCVFIVTDSEVYKHIPANLYSGSVPIIIMTAPFTTFCLTFGMFSTNYCRKLKNCWRRVNCVSVVSEPPKERIARLRLQRQSQRRI